MLNRPFKVILARDGEAYAESSFDTLREANELADEVIAAFKDKDSTISVSILYLTELQSVWRRAND